jgi:hypothetical protein
MWADSRLAEGGDSGTPAVDDRADGRFEPLASLWRRPGAVADMWQRCAERQVPDREQSYVLLTRSSEPSGERGQERVDSVVEPLEL